MIRHYYHVYADGEWREAVTEHLDALRGIGEPMRITVGVVGSPGNRAEVRGTLGELDVSRWVEADVGWEQVTLACLRRDLRSHDDPVLYSHTKGAHDSSELRVAWRRSMTRHVVGDWRHCLDMLDSVDAVGCHWLTADHGLDPRLDGGPLFAGNFWWATARYLRTLPELDMTSRWKAEVWIGRRHPQVHDLLPGWPSLPLYAESATWFERRCCHADATAAAV